MKKFYPNVSNASNLYFHMNPDHGVWNEYGIPPHSPEYLAQERDIRGDKLTYEQLEAANKELLIRLGAQIAKTEIFRQKWHDARYHLRVANKALMVHSTTIQLLASRLNQCHLREQRATTGRISDLTALP
jgi:hypothetical protein